MFVDYVYLTLIFDALSLITDIQPSTVLHISCIIFIEKNPYCSKFTLFKTRFLSLAHFYLLHKIGYATPWCLFYLQKNKWPSLVCHRWIPTASFAFIYVYWLCANSLIELLILIHVIINSVMQEWFSKGVWSLKTVTVLWSHGHNLTVMKLCRCQCTRKM